MKNEDLSLFLHAEMVNSTKCGWLAGLHNENKFDVGFDFHLEIENYIGLNVNF